MTIDLNLEQTNHQLQQEIRRQAKQLTALNRVAASVGQSLDLDDTLQVALEAVLETTQARAGGISLIEAETGDVVLRAQTGWHQDYVSATPMRVPAGHGLSGRVVQNDEVVVIDDLNPSQPLAVPSFHDEQFRSMVMAPMHARGRIIGILSIMSTIPGSFNDIGVEVLKIIADTVGVALDNARLYETMQENQQRLSAILYSTADGIFATDRQGCVQIINPAAAEMLNIDVASVRGLHLSELPVDAHLRDALVFALAARGGGDERWNKSFRVFLPHERVVSVLISPIHIESQLNAYDSDGWIIVLQDVTHLREAEVERARFIQTAAHDMRNPLSAAMSAITLLKRMLKLNDDEVMEVIDIAQSSIERIQALIDDLSQLEKIDSAMDFEMQPTHIHDVVEYVCAELYPSIQARRIGYAVVVEPNVSPIMLDQKWIRKAMINYLDNAIKAANSRVLLNVYTNDTLLHIEISDDGPGIAPEAQGRLFERFFRPNRDRESSTGLGLAIVKSIAEAHGGSVYLQSKPGEGSVFGFTIQMTAAGEPVLPYSGGILPVVKNLDDVPEVVITDLFDTLTASKIRV